jgi:hypothetical protein
MAIVRYVRQTGKERRAQRAAKAAEEPVDPAVTARLREMMKGQPKGGTPMDERSMPKPARREFGEIYLIWSHEHGQWWRGRNGYTASMSEAGHFSREEALQICLGAMPRNADMLGALPELPVRLADVLAFTSPYLAKWPDRQHGRWK